MVQGHPRARVQVPSPTTFIRLLQPHALIEDLVPWRVPAKQAYSYMAVLFRIALLSVSLTARSFTIYAPPCACRTLDPFNEPSSNYWWAGNNQEVTASY